jgi:hypothetical protein
MTFTFDLVGSRGEGRPDPSHDGPHLRVRSRPTSSLCLFGQTSRRIVAIGIQGSPHWSLVYDSPERFEPGGRRRLEATVERFTVALNAASSPWCRLAYSPKLTIPRARDDAVPAPTADKGRVGANLVACDAAGSSRRWSCKYLPLRRRSVPVVSGRLIREDPASERRSGGYA